MYKQSSFSLESVCWTFFIIKINKALKGNQYMGHVFPLSLFLLQGTDLQIETTIPIVIPEAYFDIG